jgi:hypothetical protein
VSGDPGRWLAEGGAVVGGGAALGATVGFIAGSVVHDFRRETDPDHSARRGGLFGGVFGLVVLLSGGLDSTP